MKKVVFIGHPVSGDIEGNIKKILAICKKVHSDEIIPCVPYLVSLQYLDDSVVEDRDMGIVANLECFHRGYIDELWLFGDNISKGMEQEIELAMELGVPIIPKTEITQEDFKKIKDNRGIH
jgi:hypothetical protein